MTPQEQELLTNLTQKINQTQLQEKDPDAENLLGHELGANPDALYILAQTVLVQNIALEQAKGQVAQLQQQLQQAQQARQQQPAHASSFLGRLLGEKDPQPAAPAPQGQGWGGQQPPPYQPVPQYSQQQYAPLPPPQYAPQPQYQQAQYVPVSGGQPSFLRGAMQTAAGVAAGGLAFEGVESVLHSFGHGGYEPGFGGMGMGPGVGLGGGGFERPVEETVINNYYDQPGGGGGEHHFHESGANFSDADYRDSGGDPGGGYDRTQYDNSDSGDPGGGYDSGNDDMASLDDGGGGFDDGGGSDSGSNDA